MSQENQTKKPSKEEHERMVKQYMESLRKNMNFETVNGRKCPVIRSRVTLFPNCFFCDTGHQAMCHFPRLCGSHCGHSEYVEHEEPTFLKIWEMVCCETPSCYRNPHEHNEAKERDGKEHCITCFKDCDKKCPHYLEFKAK